MLCMSDGCSGSSEVMEYRDDERGLELRSEGTESIELQNFESENSSTDELLEFLMKLKIQTESITYIRD